jgi:hypothetical protein
MKATKAMNTNSVIACPLDARLIVPLFIFTVSAGIIVLD